MNLLTLIKQNQKINIKVSSLEGSNFWYCGKADTKYSLPSIAQEQKAMIRYCTKQKKISEDRLANLDKIFDKLVAQAQKKKKNPTLHIAELNKRREVERKSLPKEILFWQWCIDTPLLERNVKETVEGCSPDEKPCLIVYVKGLERGDYSTIVDYQERNKPLEQRTRLPNVNWEERDKGVLALVEEMQKGRKK